MEIAIFRNASKTTKDFWIGKSFKVRIAIEGEVKILSITTKKGKIDVKEVIDAKK